MKFTMIVATIATVFLAQTAVASQQDDAGSSGVVILNTNSNNSSANANQSQTADQKADSKSDANADIKADQSQGQKAVQQPTTIVEASPAAEARVDEVRKERQSAEVQTEQKIVEKLEDSRLQDEKARAERLFGNKLDAQVQTTTTTTVTEPVKAEPVKVEPAKATQVTIEKVEIIQPKEEKIVEVKKEEVKKEEVVEEVKTKAPIATEEVRHAVYTVGGSAGNLQYAASNVKSNYGLGVSVGTILDDRIALEVGYLYSNHYINTFWETPIYRQLDQNDIYVAGKYYLLEGKLKPYGGVSLDYINRSYTQRFYNNTYSNDSEQTNAVNMGVLLGVDFELSRNFLLGLGYEYSFNLMNTNEPDWVANYGVPAGTTPLEKISFSQITVNAKFLF